MKFICAVCDTEHEGFPDLAFAAPAYYDALPEAQRAAIATLEPDFCRVGDDFFLRGSLELPIVGSDDSFSYGIWISVSRKSFDRYREIFGLEHPPPDRYVGWVSNQVPGYPDTLKLKAAALPRPQGRRLRIELEPTNHPLAVLQREGISAAAVVEICSAALHGSAS